MTITEIGKSCVMTFAWRMQFNLRETNRQLDELERETVARIRRQEDCRNLSDYAAAQSNVYNTAQLRGLYNDTLFGNLFGC